MLRITGPHECDGKPAVEGEQCEQARVPTEWAPCPVDGRRAQGDVDEEGGGSDRRERARERYQCKCQHGKAQVDLVTDRIPTGGPVDVIDEWGIACRWRYRSEESHLAKSLQALRLLLAGQVPEELASCHQFVPGPHVGDPA